MQAIQKENMTNNTHNSTLVEYARRLDAIWKRNLEDLPVAKDIPRLARKIKIHKNGNEFAQETPDDLIEWVPEAVLQDDSHVRTGDQSATQVIVFRLLDHLERQFLRCNHPTTTSTTTTRSNNNNNMPSTDAATTTTVLQENANEPMIQQQQQQQQQQQTAADGSDVNTNNQSPMPSSSSTIDTTTTTTKEEEADEVREGITPEQRQRFAEFTASTAVNNHQSLTEYLVRRYGETHRLVKLLKVCHQVVVIAFMRHLKDALQGVEFRDARGSWYIHFKQHPITTTTTTTTTTSSSSSSNDNNNNGDNNNDFRPSVTHRRTEQVYKRGSKENGGLDELGFPTDRKCLCFTWEIEVQFDSMARMDHIHSVAVRLLNIVFNNSDGDGLVMTDEEMRHEEELVRRGFERCGGVVTREQIMSAVPSSSPSLSQLLSPVASGAINFGRKLIGFRWSMWSIAAVFAVVVSAVVVPLLLPPSSQLQP